MPCWAEVRSALPTVKSAAMTEGLARVVEGLADPRGLVRFQLRRDARSDWPPAIPFLLKGPAAGTKNVAVPSCLLADR